MSDAEIATLPPTMTENTGPDLAAENARLRAENTELRALVKSLRPPRPWPVTADDEYE